MTEYNTTIVDADGNRPVFGDHVTITRTPVTGIPTGDELETVWLTVKSVLTALDADAELQITITTTPTANGQITDSGSGDESGAFSLIVTPSDYSDLEAGVNYFYDIQGKTADGTIYTFEKGKVKWEQQVTRATS